MKKILFISAFIFSLMFFVSTVSAQYGQYGEPSPTYSIVIDKMVGKPYQTKGGVTNYDYVDNLSVSDPRFFFFQEVWFKIKIKNTSNQNLTAVTVVDYVPEYLVPIEGPGKWNLENRTITWNAGDFNVDEEKVYHIKMQVYEQSMLPADKGLFCLVNRVEAKKDNVAYDDDRSQLCVEKQVTGVKKVPSAGPEMGLILLAGNLLGIGVGLQLRKK